MEIPEWLKTEVHSGAPVNSLPITRYTSRKRSERFLDKTLRYLLSFIEDTVFNESTSTRNGLLQMIEPRLKVVTVLFFIVALSLQKSIGGIGVFSLFALLMVFASKLPLDSFLKKLLPAVMVTFFVSIPVILNIVVEGKSLLVLYRFEQPGNIGPVLMPKEISVTEQGLYSAVILLLRVITSVSFVFLITMTTQPNAFMKALSSLIPGPLKSVVSISYRYIFFLVKKTEQLIMGLKSRRISAMRAAKGQRWVASRIGLLFSVSIELSNELEMAMKSRGYRGESPKVHPPWRTMFKVAELSRKDIAWLIFTMFFCGGMIWKSSM